MSGRSARRRTPAALAGLGTAAWLAERANFHLLDGASFFDFLPDSNIKGESQFGFRRVRRHSANVRRHAGSVPARATAPGPVHLKCLWPYTFGSCSLHFL